MSSVSRRSSRSRRSDVYLNPLMMDRYSSRSNERIMEMLTEAITELKISTLETRSLAFRTDARVDELAKRVETLEEARWVPCYDADGQRGQSQVHQLNRRPTPPMSPFVTRASSIGPENLFEVGATMQRNVNTVSTTPRNFADRPRQQPPPVRHLFVKPTVSRASPVESTVSSGAERNVQVPSRIRKADLKVRGDRYICPKCGSGYASSYVLIHVRKCKAGGRC